MASNFKKRKKTNPILLGINPFFSFSFLSALRLLSDSDYVLFKTATTANKQKNTFDILDSDKS